MTRNTAQAVRENEYYYIQDNFGYINIYGVKNYKESKNYKLLYLSTYHDNHEYLMYSDLLQFSHVADYY